MISLVMAVSFGLLVLGYGGAVIVPRRAGLLVMIGLAVIAAPPIFMLSWHILRTRNVAQISFVGLLAFVVGALALVLRPVLVIERLDDYLQVPPSVTILAGACAGAFVLSVAVMLVVPNRTDAPYQFYATSLVLLLYFGLGLLIYDDYGISADEPVQRQHGIVAINYLAERFAPSFTQEYIVEDLAAYRQRYYGVAFHLPLSVFEVLNDIQGAQIWFTRHYFTFLFFYAGVLAFYRLAYESFEDGWLALFGAAILVLNPRIFAQSFYNIKDIVFLSAFAIALYFGFKWWRTRVLGWGLGFAVAAAFAATVRIFGLGLLLLVLAIHLLDSLQSKQARTGLQITAVPLTIITFFAVYVLISPAAYSAPFAHLQTTVLTFTSFEDWGGEVLFMDRVIDSTSIPWFYLPVWLGISVPLGYQLLFIAGVVSIVAALPRTDLKSYIHAAQREPLLYLLLFTVPIAALIALESTVYNGWRHIAFLMVPFTLVALVGAQQVMKALLPWGRAQPAAIGLLVVYLSYIAGWLVVNHPHQYVYFNPLVAVVGGRESFERDYWRLSMREGLEWVAESKTTQPPARVAATDSMLVFEQQTRILAPAVRERLRLVSLDDDPDWVIETYANESLCVFESEPVYEIVVDGLPILTIYQTQSQR